MSSLYVLYDNPELNMRVRPAMPQFQLIKKVVADVREWNSLRVARHEINAMPDYILDDLGMERSEIADVVGGVSYR